MHGEYPHLKSEQAGEICWVTIDRQGDRNSLNSELIAELTQHLEDIERRDSVRAVVYTGAGDSYFIGGADGVEMMNLSPEEAKAFSSRIQGLFNRMQESPLILVAAINGLCFGGGFEFALACDLRLASENARIGLPEVKVGLIPGGGGTQRLPRLVGMGRAMEMILTGHLFPAEEALHIGLIHRLACRAELRTRCEETLKKILRQPQYALSAAKQSVYASMHLPLDRGLVVEQHQFSTCFSHDFFPNLMRDQLATGELKTTSKKSRRLEE
jgi:enoyl-CoA hydratase/carnithine racemase